MRIAFLTMGKDIGGAAQDVITLSIGLAEKGHEVFVLSSPGVMELTFRDTEVCFIEAPLYTRNPIGLWRASREIRRIARSKNLEILNPQGMYTALSSWLAGFGFRKSSFKVITTIHMISSLKLYRFVSMLNIFSDHIITESYCERNRLTSNGVKRKIVTVIANSVDMEKFSETRSKPVLREEYKLMDSCYCFGIIARLSKEKRHSDFIQAAKIAHSEIPDARFFIVGDGPEKGRIIKEMKGCEDFILMTGARIDIPDVLKSINCFVLSSEVESLPLSIREAMSMSLPVIATDVGGIREAVIHGITGIAVPPKNPEILAQAMVKMAQERESAKQMGIRGMALCRTNFELSLWVAKTEATFSKVIKKHCDA
jgi:glycosyltransferase involved in cell wall biosynthesis